MPRPTTPRYHLKKSAPDMIAATAVAIPTARTHQSPQRTVVTRTTYSVLQHPQTKAGVQSTSRAPNSSYRTFSASPHNSYAVDLERKQAELQQRRGASSRYRDPLADSSTPLIPHGVSSHRSHRTSQSAAKRVESKLDLVLARNRELELQVLALQQDVMNLRAASASGRQRGAIGPKATSKKRKSAYHRDAEDHERRMISDAQNRIPPPPFFGVPIATPRGLQRQPIGRSADTTRHTHSKLDSHNDAVEDDEFVHLQRSYWHQSQSILQELDKRLHDMSRVSAVSTAQSQPRQFS